MLAMVSAGPALAQPQAVPPAAISVVEDAMSMCRGGHLVIDAGAFHRADFNGDAVEDVLVDYGGLGCSSFASLFCGSAGCQAELVVSRPGRRWSRVPIDNMRGFTVDRSGSQALIHADLHGSACGKAGHEPCRQTLRFEIDRFVKVTSGGTGAAEASVPGGWQVRRRPNGDPFAIAESPDGGERVTFACMPWGHALIVKTPARLDGQKPVIGLRGPRYAAAFDATALRGSPGHYMIRADHRVEALFDSAEAPLAIEAEGRPIGTLSTAGARAAFEQVLSFCPVR